MKPGRWYRRYLPIRPRQTGGTMPPYRPDDDRVLAVLSPGRSASLRPGETHVEAMARLLEGVDLDPSPLYGPEPEHGPDPFGRRFFAPAQRPAWWRRLLRAAVNTDEALKACGRPAMIWRISPTGILTTSNAAGSYTDVEFDAQQWPPCPVCGATIDVDRVDCRMLCDPEPRYITGQWRCLNAMTGYEGPATLIDDNGVEIPVQVDLQVRRDGALLVWFGTATGDDFDATAIRDCVVRLPDGREGRVRAKASVFGTTIDLRGSKEPPWDTHPAP